MFLDLDGIFLSHLHMESSPDNLGYSSEESYRCKQAHPPYHCGELVSLSSLMNITNGYGGVE